MNAKDFVGLEPRRSLASTESAHNHQKKDEDQKFAEEIAFVKKLHFCFKTLMHYCCVKFGFVVKSFWSRRCEVLSLGGLDVETNRDRDRERP